MIPFYAIRNTKEARWRRPSSNQSPTFSLKLERASVMRRGINALSGGRQQHEWCLWKQEADVVEFSSRDTGLSFTARPRAILRYMLQLRALVSAPAHLVSGEKRTFPVLTLERDRPSFSQRFPAECCRPGSRELLADCSEPLAGFSGASTLALSPPAV